MRNKLTAMLLAAGMIFMNVFCVEYLPIQASDISEETGLQDDTNEETVLDADESENASED